MGNVDKTIYNTLYSNSKIETINKENDIDDVFESVYSTVRSNMQKSLGKGSNGIIGLVIDHDINIPKYDHLAGNSYIKLSKNKTTQETVWLIFKILMIMNALNGV